MSERGSILTTHSTIQTLGKINGDGEDKMKNRREDNLTVKSFKYIISWYRAANRGRNKLPVFNDTKDPFS